MSTAATAPTAGPGGEAPSISVKLLAVGDDNVGKTCLLLSYTNGKSKRALSFEQGSYQPTVFDTYEAECKHSDDAPAPATTTTTSATATDSANASGNASGNAIKVTLELFDTAGSADYDRLRPISYASGPDVVLVCYSAVSKESLDHAIQKWVPEVRRHLGRSAKFMLVGLQCDAKAALLLGPDVLRIALGRPETEGAAAGGGTLCIWSWHLE